MIDEYQQPKKRAQRPFTASQTWQVTFDPNGTFHPSARFSRADLNYGAANRVWVRGTKFKNLNNGKNYYFDDQTMSIRMETL